MDFTVLVIGGGPSGALAALKLARAGADVRLIARERPERPEAAEILPPEGHEVLAREDLWPRMPRAFARPCPAMAAVWDAPEPAWTSFATHPLGFAWHLDRIRFDAWMLDEARAAGVEVLRGAVDDVRRDEDGWRVTCSSRGDRRTTWARGLVLASGRSSGAFGLARRQRIDALCLVAGTADPDRVDPDALVVEATADGWWYSAPLVSGRLFTGWMTDFSLVPGGRYQAAAAASLTQTPWHARRVVTPRLQTTIGSASSALVPAAGPGWIAVGDAALARDPIGGDGLTSALRSACEAATVVARALHGDHAAWTEAAEAAADASRRYRQRRLDLYRAAARRWPSAPFWRRFAEATTAP